MSVKANAYRTEIIRPSGTATSYVYTIASYTDTVLNSVDDYRVIIEPGATPTSAYVSAKSSTGFTITGVVQSPPASITVWLEFMRPVDGVAA